MTIAAHDDAPSLSPDGVPALEEKALISVIVPACNAETTITACLKSLIAQDYPFLELIVVNDASADSTAERAIEMGVCVVSHQQRMGSARARNSGVANSSGVLLLFVDSDVVVPPDAVSKAYAALRERQGSLAIGGLYSANTERFNFVSDYKNLDLSFRGRQSVGYNCYLATYFVLLRKTTFYEAGGFSPDYTVEDIEFFYRVSKGLKNLYLCGDIFVDHLKCYGLIGMLRTNDYRILGMMKIIRDSRGTFKAGEAAGLQYFMNILLPNLTMTACLVGIWLRLLWPCAALLAFFMANNTAFFRFIRRCRGVVFMAKSSALLFLEYLLVPWSIVFSYLRLMSRTCSKG